MIPLLTAAAVGLLVSIFGTPYAIRYFRRREIGQFIHRTRVEAQLARFKFITDHSVEALALLDRDGRHVYVNQTHCRLHGYSAEELLNMGALDLNPSMDLERFHQLFDASQTGADAVNKSANETHERILFSEKFACPVSGFTIPEIEPRLFSFNNPFGACPSCDGLGSQRAIDASLVVPDENVSLRDGAVAPWAKSSSPYYAQTLDALGKLLGDKKPEVRSAAIMAYWSYGDGRVAEAIEQRLADERSSADFIRVNEDLKRLLIHLQRQKKA